MRSFKSESSVSCFFNKFGKSRVTTSMRSSALPITRTSALGETSSTRFAACFLPLAAPATAPMAPPTTAPETQFLALLADRIIKPQPANAPIAAPCTVDLRMMLRVMELSASACSCIFISLLALCIEIVSGPAPRELKVGSLDGKQPERAIETVSVKMTLCARMKYSSIAILPLPKYEKLPALSLTRRQLGRKWGDCSQFEKIIDRNVCGSFP